MQAFIKAISYYLPEQQLTNQQLAERFPEWQAEKIAGKIGVQSRHIAATDELASDLALKAALKLFEEHQIDPLSIDLLLYCTQSPDYFLPTTACILQDKLGIPTTAGALDFNLGCSGYVYGLAMAKGFVTAGIAKNALLLTAETYSKYIHPEDKSNLAIFGDGAAATLISMDGFASIGEFELGTDGSGADNLIVKNGALKNRNLAPTNPNPSTPDDYLYMDGAEIFNFTSSNIPALVTNVLTKNKLDKAKVGYFILHQANSFMLEHLRKKMNIQPVRFHNDIKNTGNTVSSTIPIALYQLLQNGARPDGHCLLAGFGVGYSWAATIISFKQN